MSSAIAWPFFIHFRKQEGWVWKRPCFLLSRCCWSILGNFISHKDDSQPWAWKLETPTKPFPSALSSSEKDQVTIFSQQIKLPVPFLVFRFVADRNLTTDTISKPRPILHVADSGSLSYLLDFHPLVPGIRMRSYFNNAIPLCDVIPLWKLGKRKGRRWPIPSPSSCCIRWPRSSSVERHMCSSPAWSRRTSAWNSHEIISDWSSSSKSSNNWRNSSSSFFMWPLRPVATS